MGWLGIGLPAGAAAVLIALTAYAQDATWGTAPATADFNTATNWTPATVPAGTASFGASTKTTLTFSTPDTAINNFQFSVGAPTYTFNVGFNELDFNGVGIVNNSSNTPAVKTNGGTLTFNNSSTAANASITNAGFGTLSFSNFSTAGSATIANNSSFIFFNDNSSAGSSTITNKGSITFSSSSTAGSAAITNSAGGFLLSFADTSSAGSATITTNAGSQVQFTDGATGGTARIITNVGGNFDMSGLTTGGMTAGSIEGAGAYNLGSNALTVGGNNRSTAVSGVISDCASCSFGGTGGSLIKIGTGTLTLSGANTYSGGTTMQVGTLLLAGAGTLGATSGPLAVSGGTLDLGGTSQTTGPLTLTGGTISNGTLTSSAFGAQAGVISAVLAGGGALTKTGSGTVILSGINTYTGATTINGGTLEVDGSITDPTVNAGGVLTGSGSVGATQINAGGTFAPGSGTPGTFMAISGNLGFTSGAIYLVQLSPTTTATTSAIVSGTATLAGTVQGNLAGGANSHQTYDILSVAGGFGGTAFAGSVVPNYNSSLSYTTTEVLLTLNGVALGNSSGLNQNQQAVANTLSSFVNNGSTLPPPFANLFNLTGPGLASALSQLDGEVATGAEHGAIMMMTQFLGLMLDPFVDGRFGSGGTSGGQAIGFAPEEDQFLPPDLALAYASILNRAGAAPLPFVQRWTSWGASYGGGNFSSGNGTVGSSNVSSQVFGFVGGMDYHYSPDTIVGFALGGGGVNWALANGPGSGQSNALQSGVYGVTRFGPAYLAGSLSFANQWMTTNRGALGDQLNANFVAQSYGARVEGGYRYAVLPTFGVTPYGALQVQDFHTPGYSETDLTGGGLGLTYASMNAVDVRTEIGARFDSPMVVAGMPVILRGRLSWAHDFVSNPALSAVFQSLPGSNFVVNGAAIPHDSALVSGGAELYLMPRWSFLAKFDGEFALGAQTYAGTGTVRYIW